MRNEVPQPQPQQTMSDSITRVRELMSQIQGMNNKEAFISNFIQNNPQFKTIMPMLQNGMNLETIAKSMASMNGINLNDLVKSLLKTNI